VSTWRRTLSTYLGVFLIYACLTAAMTWPVATRLSAHLLGSGDDMWVHYWNNWWVKYVLQRGGDVFHTPFLFHPTGVSLVYHNFAWVNIALWLVLEPITGGIAAYNLVHLIHIPLCGLATFALVRRLTKSNTAAFLAGLVYAFWPYRMLDTNHPNMVSTEGFPLLMLALWGLCRNGKPVRDGLIAGVLLALVGYMRWQLLILAGFMVALYLLYSLIWERERWNWGVVGGLALMAVVALVLMGPALVPLMRETLASDASEELYVVSTADPEQDLLAWIAPQHQHLLGAFHTRVFQGYGQSEARAHHSAFLGYVAVGLVVVGVVKQRNHRMTWFWLGLALLCFAFALGPTLRFNDVEYPRVPLPYRLIGWLPPIQMLRHPHRFSALLGLPVAVLAGLGASAIKSRVVRPYQGKGRVVYTWVVTVLLGLLILVDYFCVPTDTVTAHVPAFYSALAEEPGDFAIVGLPGKRQITERYMFYQTIHGRPLLSGHVSRLPPQAMDFADSIPLVAGMYRRSSGGIAVDAPDISRQLSALSDAGFRYIVIHKELAKTEHVNTWQSYLAISPRYEDSEVIVYSTAVVAGEDFALEHSFGAGVGIIQVDLKRGENQDSALELEIVWGTTAPPGDDLVLDVSLVDEEGNVRQTRRFEVLPTWSTSEWPANAVVRGEFTIETEPDVGEGLYAVAVTLVRSEDGQAVGQVATVGAVVVASTEGGRRLLPLAQRIDARFGDEMRLRGYDLSVVGDEARVTLHWQALRPMEDSYKFFVHLTDAESGELVSQADVVPREWMYPTTLWRAGEIVPDEIIVPLGGVGPGVYQLWVGVYQPDTGERLPIDEVPSALVARDGRLMLPDRLTR
jgi:hypothetical protein